MVKIWNLDIMLISLKLLVNVSKDELLAVARASSKKSKTHYIAVNDLNEISGIQYHAYLLSGNDATEAETKTELIKLIFERVTNHD